MLHWLLYPSLIQILLMMVEFKQHTNANTMNAGTQATQKIIQTTQLQESIKFLNKINRKEKRETINTVISTPNGNDFHESISQFPTSLYNPLNYIFQYL